MPENKDFKRLVRARMAKTGERYTEARVHLRPERASAAPGSDARPPLIPPTVVPTDFSSFTEWRAEGNGVAIEHRGGAQWQLLVEAAGPLEEMERAVIPLSVVAALGTALHGVGYLAFGLELAGLHPEGSHMGPRAPAPVGSLTRAQEELASVLRHTAGLDLPRAGPRVMISHRSRSSEDGDGPPRWEARTKTMLFAGPDDEAVVDFAGLVKREPSLPGRPWAGYGVVVFLDREFPQRWSSPNVEKAGVFFPEVERDFWDQAGEAMRATAGELGLPPWPLDEGWLQNLSSLAKVGTRYRPRWAAL